MKRRRRGTTLIEMVASFSAGAVALGLSILLIHSLLKLDQSSRARLADGATLGQLARTFRDDVRAAASAEVGDRLELRLSRDEVVTYEPRAGRLARIRRIEGDVDHNDRFRLPARSSARFLREDAPGRPRIVLLLEPTGLRIEAALGRDHRFSEGP